MLREIRIRNLAIVEDATIYLAEGLNVMTGSTGAGKSIILAAVDLLSGARARKSLIRKGAANLTVEGVFSIDDGWPLRERLGLSKGETELSLRRELAADGRNRIWINGMLSTVASSQETARALIELHGQHRQQEFLDPTSHILYLDAWGDYGELLGRSMAAIAAFGEVSERLARLVGEEEEHRRREDYLRFQLAELDELRLERDLDRRLESKIRQLENKQKYISALEEALSALEGDDGSAADRLIRAAKSLESIAGIGASWGIGAETLKAARISVQDIARTIGRSLAEAEDASEDLESLQQRLAGIQRACRKHALDCAALVSKRDEIRGILASLGEGSTAIADAKRERERVRRILVPMLEDLSRRRGKNAERLDGQVTGELQELGMKGALFTTRVERLENNALQDADCAIHLTPRGWDRVEFMIRTNVGEEIHPLAEIASGGDLSRITLVLKKLEVEEKRIPTLIFDEIDTGLGADLGVVVADRLAELSRRYQIICITHLPQVAARAAHHIRVEKQVKGERTIASARMLEGRERVAEIARMLGGKGKLREELAEELLDNGQGRP
ncbi:MAG: DNA repair protein RecN [Candidatus Krumholzibacteria bacterium]|nr:DNA repair protein RecN [Candidatus Krumholzibacteria bacterium]